MKKLQSERQREIKELRESLKEMENTQKKVSHSRGNRSVPKIFDQFICSSLGVPMIDPQNFEQVLKRFTTSC